MFKYKGKKEYVMLIEANFNDIKHHVRVTNESTTIVTIYHFDEKT